ncbi:Cap15 family cyclic dinucleotide receptor domain-containing protein [Empedobacter tilapiae]
MKKQEISRFISITIMLSSIFTIIYLLLNEQYDLSTIFKGFSSSITIVTLFWTFYFTYGWKWCILNKIFYKPNLNGTWKGKLISDWGKDKGIEPTPRIIYIVIRQNFLRIHFTTFTESFIGYSYSETLSLKPETGLKNVAYLYRKETSSANDEDLREGATELRYIKDKFYKKLVGKFWTNTKSQGTIEVEFVSKEYIDSYESGNKLCEN